jgi:hypothetical protein
MLGRQLNALLRLAMAYFLLETILKPKDPRFAGKAIPLRNAIILGGLSLLFPWLHFRRPGKNYPWDLDNLYMSIYVLDMAGNSFNLYDTHKYFDMVAHFHGAGAGAYMLKFALERPTLSAVGLANMLHILLEAQEYYTDVIFGTHNVNGLSDHVNDLLLGMAGTIVYGGLAEFAERRSRPKRRVTLKRSNLEAFRELDLRARHRVH